MRPLLKVFFVNFLSPLFLQSSLSTSMILHILFGILSHVVDISFSALHLLLIINISTTAQFMWNSIFKNFK
jgi:hypothetical protein